MMNRLETPTAFNAVEAEAALKKWLGDKFFTIHDFADDDADEDGVTPEQGPICDGTSRATIDQIIAAVAIAHNVTREQLTGPSRQPRHVRSRQHAMWVIRKYSGLKTIDSISYLLRRDTKTVAHSLSVIASFMDGRRGAVEQERMAAMTDRVIAILGGEK